MQDNTKRNMPNLHKSYHGVCSRPSNRIHMSLCMMVVGVMCSAILLATSVALYAQGTTTHQSIRLVNPASPTNGITLQPPTGIASYSLTLPATQGLATTLLLNDGTGGLSWVTLPSLLTSTGWALTGNSTLTSWNGLLGSFIGTTSAQPLAIATTNSTAQDIRFFTGANGANERMRILGSGNIGIGTTTPTTTLQVNGTSRFSGGNMLIDTSAASTAGQLQLMNPARTFQTNIQAGAQTANITYTLPTAAPTAGQVLTSDASGNMSWSTALTGTSGWALSGNAPTASWNGTSGSFLGTTNTQPLSIATTNATAQDIRFYTGANGANERMRILSTGNIGIGTITPTTTLHVNGTSRFSGGNMLIDTSAASTAGQLQLMNPARTFQTNIQAGAQTANITYTLPTAAPTAGQVLTSDASGNMSWSTPSTTATALPLSGLTAATATNTINSAGFAQTWQWNSLAGTTALTLSSSSTAAASNAQTLLNLSLSGANATSTQTTYGAQISNTHTGTSSTNVGLSVSASGGTNNYALVVPNGNVAIGVNAPSSLLEVSNAATAGATPGGLNIGLTSQYGTLIHHWAPATGIPTNDGFRMRYASSVSVNLGIGDAFSDYLVFEKTDNNNSSPDGGIAFVNTGSSGNAVPSLIINGSSQIGLGVFPTERLHVTGNILVDTSAAGTAGKLIFNNPARTFASSFQAGAQTANITYTLPTAAPTAGQVLSSDASGNMSWIAPSTGSVTGSGAATRVAFWNSSSTLSSSSNLYWDNTNNRLGLGTSSPTVAFSIVNDGGGLGFVDDAAIYSYGSSRNPSFIVSSARGTAASPTNLQNGDLMGSFSFYAYANNSTGGGLTDLQAFYKGDGVTNLTNLVFRTGSTQRAIIDEVGNFGIGTATPTTRLHVNGASRFSGGNMLIDTSAASTAGQLQLMNPARTFQTNIQAGAQTANITYTLPTAAPTAGQILSSDASGNMSWIANGSSSGWSITGNTSTSPATNYLGTTDAQAFVIRTNAVERARFANGNTLTFGIQGTGATAPPASYTIGSAGWTGASSTNNQVGTNLLIQAGSGTGSGTPGYISMQVPTAGASGTAVQSQSEMMRINSTGVLVGGASGTMPNYRLQVDANSGGQAYANFTTGSGSGTASTDGLLVGLQNDNVNALVWNQENGYLRFGTNNTERVRIDNAGNVGIGVTTPNAALQFGNVTANRRIVLWELGNNDHQFYGFGINSSMLRYQVSNTTAFHAFYAGTSTTASNELVRIQGDGNVGIGTASPNYRLDVSGGDVRITNSNSYLRTWGETDLEYDGGTDGIYSFRNTSVVAGAKTRFWNNSSTALLTMLNTGNVGINNDSPSQLLHTMNGNILIDNNDNNARELRFDEPSGSGSNYTAFKAQSQSSNITYTLPASDGVAGASLVTNGSGTLSWSSVGMVQFVRKTADESITSSTAMQNDDDLDMSVDANQTWEVDFMLRVTSNGGDIKFAINLPAGATMWITARGDDQSSSQDDYVEMISPGTEYSFTTSGNWELNPTGAIVHLKGIVVTGGSAGTMQLRWAQRVSNGTPTVVKNFSYLKAIRVQ